jgi:hypothetical protein
MLRAKRYTYTLTACINIVVVVASRTQTVLRFNSVAAETHSTISGIYSTSVAGCLTFLVNFYVIILFSKIVLLFIKKFSYELIQILKV